MLSYISLYTEWTGTQTHSLAILFSPGALLFMIMAVFEFHSVSL